jgi:hypothetical protein
MVKRKNENVVIEFESDINNLYYKLLNDDYAKDLYRALCNMRWKKYGFAELYSCSWRYAGGLIATIRNKGEDYMTFYLSGHEGNVTDEIKDDLKKLGWKQDPWPDE